MIELFEQQIMQTDRHSSKGNQLKWEKYGLWYKADYTGYEGLAEYVVSRLLEYSNLDEREYVKYRIEEIEYKNRTIMGVSSNNILSDDWQIITLERLFKNEHNESLYMSLWRIQDVHERMKFLCAQTEKMTGINNFGEYMTKLLTLDALFKNEDRHTHNIAVLMNSEGKYKLCPIFDNGAALLSDTSVDYPLSGDVFEQLKTVRAKTISEDFDEQLDVAEELYGIQLKFNFTKKTVDEIVNSVGHYSEEEKNRVKDILYFQMRKYKYMFVE